MVDITITLANTREPQRIPVTLPPVESAAGFTSGYAVGATVMLEFRIGGVWWLYTLLDASGTPLTQPRPVVGGDLLASCNAVVAERLGRLVQLVCSEAAYADQPLAQQTTITLIA